jgi:hypothetical protein
MNKTVRWAAGTLSLAGALGTTLLSAPAASAVVPAPPSFVCPDGSDTYEVPNDIAAPNQPDIAGTVCTFAGTTAFRSVHTNGGWRVEVKDPFGSDSTNVRFFEPTFNDKAEVLSRGDEVVVRT